GGGTTVPAGLGTGATNPSIRTNVTGLEGEISVTADPATNSLIIQASQEGFNTLAHVIEKLDVELSQVSVEALIMELTVNDNIGIGFNGLMLAIDGNQSIQIASATSAATAAIGVPVAPSSITTPLLGQAIKDTRPVDAAAGQRV